MVLLTSANDCEGVVICYNGRDSPPYFTLSPHSVIAPRLVLDLSLYHSPLTIFYSLSEQVRWLNGHPVSSSLPLVGLRFIQPAIGAALISVDKDNFAALLVSEWVTIHTCTCSCIYPVEYEPLIMYIKPSLFHTCLSNSLFFLKFFHSVQLTSLGDDFYQCWHYADTSAVLPPSLSLSSSLSLSPSLSLGYHLWFSEASRQEQVNTIWTS